MNRYVVAVAQICSSDDPRENYAKAEAWIAEAAKKGASLIVFPENMNYCGKYTPEIREEIPGGECHRRLTEAAKKHGIWVHSGSIKELGPEDFRAYNTSFLISPQGETVAKYRKIHPSDMGTARESNTVIPGDEIVVADTELGKIGMAICYDIRFPELYRLMAMRGAQVVCQPARFVSFRTGSAHWEIMLRAAAIHNHAYVLAAGQCGTGPDGKVNWGHSMIIDPWGTPIASAAQEKETLLLAEIDLSFTEDMKKALGSMINRREDLYRLEEMKK